MIEKNDQNLLLLSSHFIQQREYWKEKLSGDISGTSIAPDLPSSGYGKRREQVEIPFSDDLTQRLLKLSKGSDLSIYICIVAVLKIVLQRYTSNSESIILSPINMLKVSRETMNHILFLRGALREGSTFKDLLLETRATILEAYENQDYPYEKLVEYLPGILSENFYHISTVTCALLNIHDKENTGQIGGDLSFQFERTGEQITGKLVYNADSYSLKFVDGISHHFVTVLKQAISDVNVNILDIDMLSQDEKEQLIYGFNNDTENYPKWKTLHGLFKEQVDKTPDNIVLFRLSSETNQSQSITYKQLNEMSNLMASFLKEKGVIFGTIVAIKLEKSIEMIVGILAILKAGAAYLPINPKQPEDRTQYMLNDSSAKILIDETVFEEMNILMEDRTSYSLNAKVDRSSYLESNTIAYVIYTSGSTGKPKGVAISHSNISPLLHWGYRYLELDNNDRTLQNLSYYFDWSVWEIFITLTSGSSLYSLPEEWLINPGMCIPFMEQHNITVFHATPSQYQYLIGSGRKIETLNYLFLGAEKLTLDMAKRSLESVNNKCRIFNMYGPTEATIISAVLELTRPLNPQFDNLSGIPIGKGVGNTHLFVLDNYHSLCPVKVAGELYISGDGISNGYLNNPQLTAEKFITFGDQEPFYKNVPEPPKIFDNDNIIKSFKGVEGGVLQKAPFAAGSTLYKTGDRVRWLEDGNIEFLERIDFQVKIRGFRIELGEIEAAISANPLVKEAVVIARSKGEGENMLYAYFVSDEDISVTGMQTFLKNRLPDYMVPSFFTRLEKMPLSPTGKIDRNALPEPRFSTARTYTPPRNMLETRLSRIWSEVLGLQQKGETESETLIDIDENFFNLGGHSLKATLLSSRLHKDFGVPVPLAEIFKTPTIRELAKYILSKEKETYSAIPLAEKKSIYPLSPAQKRLFFLHRMDERGTNYNMPQQILFPGSIDREQLEFVFKQLIQRHESLRTSFEIMENEPVQRIHESVDFEIRYYEESFDIKTFVRYFDLSRAPLLRVAVVQRKDKENILLIDMHHIITDGISQDILKDEFQRLYEGKGEELPSLNLQYKDYAQWQNSEIRQAAIKEQEMYWLSIYADEVPVINLPTDFPRPFVQSFDGFSIRFSLSPQENDVLRNLAKVNDATQYMSILSIFTILLSKLSGQEDIVIGTPVAARRHTDLEKIIGMFVNTLALRNKPFGYKTLNEFIMELKERTLDAFENQEYPFEELVDKLVIGRDMGRNPLFDVMFNLLNSEVNPVELKNKPEYKEMEHSPATSKFDLTLTALDFGTQTLFSIEYCSRLFRPQTIERFISYFKHILYTLSTNSNPLLSEIGIITQSEKERILFEFNNFQSQYPNDRTIHWLFDRQVQKTPDSLALIGERIVNRFTHKEFDKVIHLTYEQLNRESDQVASVLIEKGITPCDIVAIQIERSIEMITGILGILKTGAGYLPINTKNPEGRTQFMLEDCGARILIDASFFEEINHESSDPSSITPISQLHQASCTAYIIYTSGSTGNPKGVPISHSNLSPLLHWGHANLNLGTKDRFLQNPSYYFDFSVWETFLALTSGCSLYQLPDEWLIDPEKCIPFMVENNITVFNATPSQYKYLIGSGRKLETLNYLFLGAEKLTIDMAQRCIESVSNSCRIFNMYGPTEAAIISTILELPKPLDPKFANLSGIPIGKAVGNTQLFILNNYHGLCPVNVAGELYINGDCVSKGYLNNPELTAEKFINIDFSRGPEGGFYKKSPLVYKTGDRVRWLEDGTIEFLERIDFQVKIRGFRIELGEIENALLENPSIKEAVVIARQIEGGENVLLAYIVSLEDIPVIELQAFLRKRLPDYMVPSYFTRLEQMPLSPTGKIDRKALPEPDYRETATYTPPRNDVEVKLIEIWSDVLNIDKKDENSDKPPIGIDDNFFHLGGHSLKATTLVYRINKEFALDIQIKDIFTHPTIRELSAIMKDSENLEYFEIDAAEEKEYYELSYAQRRLWILCQFEEDSTAYNMPTAFILEGKFDLEAFRRTIEEFVKRHESLRTLFISISGEPCQRILKDYKFELEVFDLRHLNGVEKDTEARRIYLEIANHVFSLEKGPLFRIVPIRLEDNKHLIAYNMHHIINDGWSQGIIFNELIRLYNTYCFGEKNPLQPLDLQYKDYSIWHNRLFKEGYFIQSGNYWLEKFKDKPNGIELPFDHPRQPIQTFNGGRVEFAIDSDKMALLQEMSLKTGSTLFMSLLTLLNIFLFRYTGQKDIIIGAPIANRKRPELHPIIGFLVNTLVYRNQVDPGLSFNHLLEQTRQEALTCYHYQDYPFDLLIEQLGLERDLSQSPIFNVMIAHNNTGTENKKLSLEGITAYPYLHTSEFNMSKFDLIFFMDEGSSGIHTRIEYNSDLFERGTIERMAQSFMVITEHILAAPHLPVSQLNILSPEQQELVIHTFNDTHYDFSPKNLRELFEDRVQEHPEKVAVVDGIETISYADLNKRANCIAHFLTKKYNAKPNDIIGISMDRSIDMIAVILGIIKSGSAYLAVDPTYPPDRVIHILSDSSSSLLLTDQMRPHLFSEYKGEILDIRSLWEEIRTMPDTDPGIMNYPTDILYVNYTSGSTGTPNGAMLSHDCLTNLIRWQREKTGIDCSMKCLQFTSINFCVSFQEIMGTLTSGGELHLIGDVERQDIDYLMDFLSSHQIEILFLPFSYLNFLFNESSRWDRTFNHNLKHIITAGEQLKITAGLKKFLDLNPHIKLHNHYGSTEMHVVTSYTLDASTAEKTPIPPAGKPVSNIRIFILDEFFNPVPTGVYGELCVEGSLEILGYINNKDLTDRKLIHCPALSKTRLYRSGDIGRWLPDGNIELRGRKDFLVKVRGFRVELGEIESKILSIEKVRECVVVVKEDKANQKYLVAYVSTDGPDSAEIRRIIGSILPQYMIPKIIVLDNLPLMHNGKVDRERLPEPRTIGEDERTIVPPRNETERVIVNIWAELLAMSADQIGIEDNFFEIGGHSLKATILTSRIHKEFDVKIPLTEVFKNPTISNISEFLKDSKIDKYTAIEPAEEKEFYPLSSAQRRLFVLHQMETDSVRYNMPQAITLVGEVDIPRLETAFNRLIQRHESLRTSFEMIADGPVQRVWKHVEFKIDRYDSFIEKKDFIRSFDLSCAPLLRAGLTRNQSGENILLLDIHHIITDGTSQEILKKDFQLFYDGNDSALQPLRLQYKDYAQWQNSESQQAFIKQQESYWLELFSDVVPILNLPTDFPRPYMQSFDGNIVKFKLSISQTQVLKSLVLESDTTLYMVILAIFNILLSRLSGQEDIIVGTPLAARRHADLEKIIGMFINTLAMRNTFSGEQNFMDFLQNLKERILKAYENQEYQFEDLVEKIDVIRDTGRNPVFDVMFNLLNFEDFENRATGEAEKSEDEVLIHSEIASKFDLTLMAIDYGERIHLSFVYCTRLFKPKTIERYISYFKNIIDSLRTDSNSQISLIEILDESEKYRLLYDFNNTRTEYPDNRTLPGLFEEQAKRTPDRIALVGRSIISADTELSTGENDDLVYMSYSRLKEETDLVALSLRKQGIQSEEIAALMLPRSIEMIVGILGIMKAGGVYLPIDHDYPSDRIEYMLKDSGSKILVDISFMIQSKKNKGEETYTYSELHTTGTTNHPIGETPAYVIYTSGSTGKPKGVIIEHASVISLLTYQKKFFGFDPADRILQFSSICFDPSIEQIFLPLTSGALLAVIDKTRLLDPVRFEDFIQRVRINHLHAVPSFIGQLDFKSMYHIERVLCGGDVCPKELAAKWSSRCRFFNKYGPTETTVTAVESLVQAIDDNLSGVPIGKPVGNTYLLVLDKYMNLVPTGVSGELYIGGVGVSRGYLNRPELTADRFIPTNHEIYKFTRIPQKKESFVLSYLASTSTDSNTIYRTGDLVRWLDDGNIEFQGRIDQQLKIRGHRIEPGEIENRIREFEGVKDAIVTVRETDTREKFLCAYVVFNNPDLSVSISSLKTFLSRSLPEYMVPPFFVEMESFPLTSNGKIDRKALPAPDFRNNETFVEPRNATEVKLAGVWAELLSIEDKIGIDDNFFELGGHSLKIMNLVSRIHKEFNVKIPLTRVLNIPTIRGLAEFIEEAKIDKYASIESAEEQEYYFLSPAQKRLYILHQMETRSTRYNMPQVIPFASELDEERLKSAFQRLIQRHESLRTSFEMVGDEPVQRIHPAPEFTFDIYEDEAEIKEFIRPFDLTKAPLIRVGLVRKEDGHNSLLVDMHHIITDGVSQEILKKEFQYLYDNKDDQLPFLRLQYKDYALWQNSENQKTLLKKQESYWMTLLSDELPVLHLPTDFTRPALQSFEGNFVSYVLTHEESAFLKSLGKDFGGTLYMTVLSLFSILLSKLSGQEDIIVGTPVAARRHADLEKIIGMFVNTLVLRNKPTGDKNFLQFYREVKLQVSEAFENQEYPFEDLVDKLVIGRNISRNPVFDVMYNYVNRNEHYDAYAVEIDKPGSTWGNHQKGTSKFDLTLNVVDIGARVLLTYEYCTRLFEPHTIDKFNDYFRNLLKLLSLDSNPSLSRLEIIDSQEKHRVLHEFNKSDREFPTNNTINRLFEDQVAKIPGNTALVLGGFSEGNISGQFQNIEQLTYEELNHHANRLSVVLREKGIKPGMIVAIKTHRSFEMIIGILGILKTGAAYLPINPKQPEDRTQYMMTDSSASLLIDETFIKEAISGSSSLVSEPGIDPVSLHTAYVIYTSGSTGKPKGVPISHSNISPLLHWGYTDLGIGHEDRVIQNVSYYFDWSVWEICITLTSGASLYILPEETMLNPEECIPYINMNQITVLHSTPAQYQYFVNAGRTLDTLNFLFIGGEKLTLDIVKRSFDILNDRCRVFNMYGPTEVTIISTVLEIIRGDETIYENLSSVPIGKAIGNNKLFVMDHYFNPCPVNVIGELYISGDGVAEGYLNAPELTAERFIRTAHQLEQITQGTQNDATFKAVIEPLPHPNTIYKTGDSVRWLPNGNIEFLGRIDNQVKIRGFRIELGEIEARLLEKDGIIEAVVSIGEKKSGEKYLCAYFTAVREIELVELREFLSQKIPEYMIPSYFMQMEKMPLNPNGKIDRKKLPQPELKAGKQHVAPDSHIEKSIAQIWMEILETEQIGIDDNFFELGGNSLDAVKLSRKLKNTFDKDIPVVIVFRYPTIRTLASFIEQEEEDFAEGKKEMFEAIDKGKDKLKKRMEKRRRG